MHIESARFDSAARRLQYFLVDFFFQQSANNIGDVFCPLRQGGLDLTLASMAIVNRFDTALDMVHAALGNMWSDTESTETGPKSSAKIMQRPVRQWPPFCHIDTQMHRRRRVAPRRVSAASGAEETSLQE